jgi:hypothetical protein
VDPDDNFFNDIHQSFGTLAQSEYYTIERYNTAFSNIFPCISVVNNNICSFNAHSDSFVLMLNSLIKAPEIITLTETWLLDSNKDCAVIAGYNAYHTIRPTGRGGGVSVFVDERYSAVMIGELSVCDDTIESCVVRVTCDGEEYFIVALYRPHSDTIENFNARTVNVINHDLVKIKICWCWVI